MRYPGGKGKCFQRLISLMPPHTTYIESHLGGGAVLRNKRPADVNIGIDADPNVIKRWQRDHPGLCQLVNGDAESFLTNYDFRGGELIYSDPPYLIGARRKKNIYRHDYAASDHEVLLTVLKALPCKVMVSGYDTSMYREYLAGWRCVSFPAMTHTGVREEYVWLNFDPPTRLHDASHLGATFHERQSIKRRFARMENKFGRMKQVERNHLLVLLNERFGAMEGGS